MNKGYPYSPFRRFFWNSFRDFRHKASQTATAGREAQRKSSVSPETRRLPMEFNQVETFLAVLTYGGFHKAAEALRVSQPAVSARIRALEESLGVTLFARDGNSLSLSP